MLRIFAGWQPAVRLSAANSVEDMDLIGSDRCIQTLQSLYIIASDKDVHVLADLALFVEYAVAECGIDLPKRIERFANGRKISVELLLRFAAGVALEMSAEINSY
jgi:hypothetical protein